MRERNKSIFSILLIISVGLMLLQTILLATLMPGGTQGRILAPLLLLLSEISAGGMLIYFNLNPQYNHNYGLQREEGRLRWKRITYGPDPDGLRYISSGVATLLLAVLMAVIGAAIIWPNRIPEGVPIAIGIACTLGIVATLEIVEHLLRRQ